MIENSLWISSNPSGAWQVSANSGVEYIIQAETSWFARLKKKQRIKDLLYKDTQAFCYSDYQKKDWVS